MARLSSFYIVNIFSLLRYLFNLLVFPFVVVVVVVVYPVGSSRAESQCRRISVKIDEVTKSKKARVTVRLSDFH